MTGRPDPETVSLSGGAELRLVVYRELEQIIGGDFNGKVTLHCTDGVIRMYDVVESRRPGKLLAPPLHRDLDSG